MTSRENASQLSKNASQASINMNSIHKSKSHIAGSADVLETNRSAVLEQAMHSAYFKDKVMLTSEVEVENIWNAENPNEYV